MFRFTIRDVLWLTVVVIDTAVDGRGRADKLLPENSAVRMPRN